MYDQPSDWDVVDAVERVAARRGVPMAQVALAWLLGRPGVVAPIVGATKLPQLEDALGSLSVELTAEEVAEVDDQALSLDEQNLGGFAAEVVVAVVVATEHCDSATI